MAVFLSSVLALFVSITAVLLISLGLKIIIPGIALASVFRFTLIFVIVIIPPVALFGPGITDSLIVPPGGISASAWQTSTPTKAEMSSLVALAHFPYWLECWEGSDPLTAQQLRSLAGRPVEETSDALKTRVENVASDGILATLNKRFFEFQDRNDVHAMLKRLFVEQGVLWCEDDAEIELVLLPAIRAGYFVMDRRRVVVFFRGSAELNDYENNLNTTITAWPLTSSELPSESISSTRLRALRSPRRSPKMMVHGGFLNHLEHKDSLQQLLDDLAALPSSVTELVVSGHSLGGAAAMLFVARLGKVMPSRFSEGGITLCLIACPRVGNSAFVRDALAAQSELRVWRLVNHLDPVTRLPWWLPRPGFFRHPFATTVYMRQGVARVTPPGEPAFCAPAIHFFILPVLQILFGSSVGADLTRHMIGGSAGYASTLSSAKWTHGRSQRGRDVSYFLRGAKGRHGPVLVSRYHSDL